jgi:hypothetical protein
MFNPQINDPIGNFTDVAEDILNHIKAEQGISDAASLISIIQNVLQEAVPGVQHTNCDDENTPIDSDYTTG